MLIMITGMIRRGITRFCADRVTLASDSGKALHNAGFL
jgi:hypothetical protein